MNASERMEIYKKINEEEFIKIGREKVFEDSISSWFTLKAFQEDDEVETISFADWCKEIIWELPPFMSKDNFVETYWQELKAMYNEQRDKAIDDFYGRRKEDER